MKDHPPPHHTTGPPLLLYPLDLTRTVPITVVDCTHSIPIYSSHIISIMHSVSLVGGNKEMHDVCEALNYQHTVKLLQNPISGSNREPIAFSHPTFITIFSSYLTKERNIVVIIPIYILINISHLWENLAKRNPQFPTFKGLFSLFCPNDEL